MTEANIGSRAATAIGSVVQILNSPSHWINHQQTSFGKAIMHHPLDRDLSRG